jgi:hypothetical protein
MQLEGHASHLPKYTSTWHAAKTVVQGEGIRGLFIGLSINYLKVRSFFLIGLSLVSNFDHGFLCFFLSLRF